MSEFASENITESIITRESMTGVHIVVYTEPVESVDGGKYWQVELDSKLMDKEMGLGDGSPAAHRMVIGNENEGFSRQATELYADAIKGLANEFDGLALYSAVNILVHFGGELMELDASHGN